MHTIHLIRTLDGVELPAAGRWSVGGGHPVRVGQARRFGRRHRARSMRGALVVGDDPTATTLDLSVETADGGTITVAGRLLTANEDGLWRMAGSWRQDGRTYPALLAVMYRGVFRRHEQATAWLTLSATTSSQELGRRQLALEAELNAQQVLLVA